MKITVTLPELPPKKDGSTSMWGKTADLPRLKLLRRMVHRELGGTIPDGRVVLTVVIYAEIADGDLDTFVSGICDGLIPAHPATPSHLRVWTDEPSEIGPDLPIAFHDDRWVSRIVAERRPVDSSGRRYELSLEWLVP